MTIGGAPRQPPSGGAGAKPRESDSQASLGSGGRQPRDTRGPTAPTGGRGPGRSPLDGVPAKPQASRGVLAEARALPGPERTAGAVGIR